MVLVLEFNNQMNGGIIMLRKATVFLLTLALSGSILAGCAPRRQNQPGGTGDQPAAQGFVPTELRVQFVPSQNAETLEAKAKPLEKLLGDRLGIPVKVSVSTKYETIIEAMASKQVDIGFLPPNAYVMAKQQGAAEILNTALRYGVNPETGMDDTSKTVDFYRGMLLVRADSPEKSIADLKGKKIAWQSVTSAAGYLLPYITIRDAGIDPDKDLTPVVIKGHDKAALAVVNGDVDVAAVFEDVRKNLKKDMPDIFEKTRVLGYTAPTPNDTIAVRPDMNAEWKKKIQQAFIDLGNNEESRKIIFDVYSHIGYTAGDDSKYDAVREQQKILDQKK
jgi:phosphonate transport system substrate-binding protein